MSCVLPPCVQFFKTMLFFLRIIFSGAYVAPAVVEQIVKHPELASLGGKSENLTALFSDVKTFSGFTEVINNQYGEEKRVRESLYYAFLSGRHDRDPFPGI